MRKKFKTALALVAVSAVTATTYVSATSSAARDRTRAHLETLAEWRAALDFDREAVWGETIDGQAWPRYEKALAALLGMEVAQFGQTRQRVLAALAIGGEAAPEERAALVEEHRESLALLREGAHARDAAIILDPRAGFDLEYPRLARARFLSDLTVMQLLIADTPQAQCDAVHGLLDGQQLGRDLACSPLLINQMIGLDAVVPSGVRDHLAEGLLDGIDDAAVQAWLRGVEAIERSLPRDGIAIRGELEMFGHGMLSAHDGQWGVGQSLKSRLSLKTWMVLSVDRDTADYLDLMIAFEPEAHAAYERGGSQGYAMLLELDRRVAADDSRVTQTSKLPLPVGLRVG